MPLIIRVRLSSWRRLATVLLIFPPSFAIVMAMILLGFFRLSKAGLMMSFSVPPECLMPDRLRVPGRAGRAAFPVPRR